MHWTDNQFTAVVPVRSSCPAIKQTFTCCCCCLYTI